MPGADDDEDEGPTGTRAVINAAGGTETVDVDNMDPDMADLDGVNDMDKDSVASLGRGEDENDSVVPDVRPAGKGGNKSEVNIQNEPEYKRKRNSNREMNVFEKDILRR